MGIAGTRKGAQKQFRKQEHRRHRKKVNDLLSIGEYELLPHPREYGNEWASPRDGKQWLDWKPYYFFGQLITPNLDKYMRK